MSGVAGGIAPTDIFFVPARFRGLTFLRIVLLYRQSGKPMADPERDTACDVFVSSVCSFPEETDHEKMV